MNNSMDSKAASHSHAPDGWKSDYCSCGIRLTCYQCGQSVDAGFPDPATYRAEHVLCPNHQEKEKAMSLINLTPHSITIRKPDGDLTIPSSGVARCSVTSEQCGDVDGVPVFRNVFGDITGLPEPTPGTTFIVSFPVLQAMAGKRSDLVGPDTSPNGGAIRNEAGQIIAVTRFQTL